MQNTINDKIEISLHNYESDNILIELISLHYIQLVKRRDITIVTCDKKKTARQSHVSSLKIKYDNTCIYSIRRHD